jgi:simple sugar transport system substrate-binding protein
MSFKRLSWIVLVILIVGLLAACQQQATQEPAEVPATEPVEEAAVEEAAPTEEMEAVEEAAPTEEMEVATEEAEMAEETQVMQEDFVYGLAVHSNPAEDSFWGVVETGARDAADKMGVELRSGGSLDPTEQAQLIENYIADEVDGIIVSLANPDAMQDAVARATEADIPLITINSGLNVYKELGAITHVGQDETVAGQRAGEVFNNRTDVSKVLCVLHEEGNIGLEARCDGMAETFGGEVERFNVATTGTRDIAGTLASIQDKLIADPDVGAILTLNPDVAMAASDAIDAAGTETVLGTFDLSEDILQAIIDGELLFTIDQQQYLQGYLPVVFLYLYNTNLNEVGGGEPVLTGPSVIDQSNAERVLDLAGQGTR